MEFKHGEKYWLSTPDGSRLLTVAWEDSAGEIDLQCEGFDFSIWAGGERNLDNYTVTHEPREVACGVCGDDLVPHRGTYLCRMAIALEEKRAEDIGVKRVTETLFDWIVGTTSDGAGELAVPVTVQWKNGTPYAWPVDGSDVVRLRDDYGIEREELFAKGAEIVSAFGLTEG